MRESAFRYLATAIAVVALVATWALFGPRQLGGAVTYVTTHGDSMEPKMYEGDLALVRAEDTYEVGDVVAYHSENLDRLVLHRVIRIDGDRFVMKGDNNDWIDSEEPGREDIVGKLWIRAGGIGRIAESLRAPKFAALAAGLIALFWITFSGDKKSRSSAATRRRSGVVSEELLTYVIAVAGAFALLTGLAFARPTQSTSDSETTYRHEGRFGYSADAPKGAVYPEGKIDTGDPVFLRLADNVDVSFDYELRSDLPLDVKGKAQLVAQLGDPAGWNRTFELTEMKEFKGSEVSLDGTLELDQMRKLIQKVERATAFPKDSYPLSVTPQVEVAGEMGEHEITGEFAPRLDMQLDALQLQMMAASSVAPGTEPTGDPLRPSLESSVVTSDSVVGYANFLGMELRVTTLRMVGIVGLLASALTAFALYMFGRSRSEAPAAVAARDRSLLLPVAPSALDAYDRIVEVTDLDSLAAMARQRERMIMTFEKDGDHHFVVDEGGVAYLVKVTPETDPAPSMAVSRTS